MRRATIVLPVLAVLTLTAVTACGARQQAGQATPVSTPALEPTSAEPPTTTVTTPTPPRRTLPKAMDGTDITACYDGACEVEVRAPLEIPLDPKTGIKKLTLDSVNAQGANLSGTTTSGGTIEGTVNADPGGLVVISFNNRFTIAALGVDNGVAILRLAPV